MCIISVYFIFTLCASANNLHVNHTHGNMFVFYVIFYSDKIIVKETKDKTPASSV